MNAESQNTDWWLKPAQQLLGHGVAQSETAAGLCDQLEGKCLQIRVAGMELLINCLINDGAVKLFTGEADRVDAQIAGSPVSLLRLSGEDPEAVIRSGAVSVSGDAEVAEDFQALFAHALIRIGTRAGLEGPAAENVGAGRTDRRGDLVESLTTLDRAGTSNHAQVSPADLHVAHLDNARFGMRLATRQLERRQDRDHLGHA